MQEESAEHRYNRLFERHRSELLRIASSIKHPCFEEEQEWRAVSPPISDLRNQRLQFREGPHRLVPYIEFRLPRTSNDDVALDHVWVGPSAEPNLAMEAVDMFLTRSGARPPRIDNSGLPFRTW